MTKILIVDDESQMRQLLKLYLNEYGYIIDEAENGIEAYQKVRKSNFDLIILDVMMPDMDGWQTLKEIRKFSEIPIIFLTAKGKTEDKVNGLVSGADDYLVKPFEEEELIARIRAVLRRTNGRIVNDQILEYKGVTLNLASREAMYIVRMINLTHTEFDLLRVLIQYRGKVLSREQLIEQVWGIDFPGEDRTIDSHIKNLREKLRISGLKEQIIETVWGIGYKIP